MLRLDKVIKPWKESAALNDHINLYGFWNETAFLTKSGDLGMVLQVQGVDYESLDTAGQEYAVKRLESALKAFGQGFHVYQYLFKANRPEIPFASYDDPRRAAGDHFKTRDFNKTLPESLGFRLDGFRFQFCCHQKEQEYSSKPRKWLADFNAGPDGKISAPYS